jgi:hypothetical protein
MYACEQQAIEPKRSRLFFKNIAGCKSVKSRITRESCSVQVIESVVQYI